MQLFLHHERVCVYDEAKAVKESYYGDQVIVDNEKKLVVAMDDWHGQVIRYSKRDQLPLRGQQANHCLAAMEGRVG